MSRLCYAERMDPQMAAALRKQQTLAPHTGAMCRPSLDEMRSAYARERRFWNAQGPKVATIAESSVPGPLGDIPIRCYYPGTEHPLPALIYLHGGGWILGNLDTHDRIMRSLAVHSGWAVVGVDYRLAPEHKFPVAINETLAVVHHLRVAGDALGLDEACFALGGDSAGANMALAAGLALGQRTPGLVRALVLFYGAYGLRDSASRRLYGGPEDGMSTADLGYYEECYLRGPADLRDPRYDLLECELAGLPPVHLCAAELDPLRDDSAALHALLRDAGVRSDFLVYAGVLHGFLHLGAMLDKAREALQRAAHALRSLA